MRRKVQPNTLPRIGFLICLLIATGIAWYFHNRFWTGPDEGYFGYVASQTLKGEVLHKNIPVLHSGLHYLINGYFLKWAGGDLVGLRYPLVAMAVIQTGIAYKLAEKRGLLVSIAAASTGLAFSFIQYINPSPNWYALCFAFILTYILSQADAKQMKTIILLGFLVGIAFLLRQLSGVILAVAVTVVLFLKNSDYGSKERLIGGKIVLLFLTLGVGLYVFTTANPVGLFLMGLTPLIVLLMCVRQCELGWQRAMIIIGLLILGAFISAIPLAFYYAINGALADWLYGMLIAATGFVELQFLEKISFFDVIGWGVKELIAGNIWALSGLFYWLVLLFAPGLLGILVIRKLSSKNAEIPVIGIMGSLFSLSAVYHEIHIYLLFCVGIVLMALLLSIDTKKTQKATAWLILVISTIAIWFQAGQPLSRGYNGVAANTRVEYVPALIPNTTIVATQQQAEKYRDVLDVIEQCSMPSDSIYAFPMNAELYLLSGRDRAFDLFVSFVGLSTEQDLQKNFDIIKSENAPTLIFHNEEDKYNTDMALKLMDKARPYYVKIGGTTDWTVYQRKDKFNQSSCVISDIARQSNM